jgi:hypothetical protein
VGAACECVVWNEQNFYELRSLLQSMFLANYKHIFLVERKVVSRRVAITIVLSFFAMWAPIVRASGNQPSVMACCMGKKAGHCHSGLVRHKLSHRSTAKSPSRVKVESASLNRRCPMNCGTCTAGTSRFQKRQKDITQTQTFHNSILVAITRFENLSPVFSITESFTHINPRGPPALGL